MTLASHRSRYLILALFVLSLGLMILARPAHGAWSAEPVQVRATTALCPLVSVASDAHGGSIAVWQENTASGGSLKAQHLLASGDLDPAWSGVGAVSSVDVARAALGAVSDGNGGVYVWWMENQSLMLSRVAPSGAIASGWPATGRNLGTLPSSLYRPRAVADGVGGIYVGWLTKQPFPPGAPANIRIVHLGPSATGSGGWPTGGRSYGVVGGTEPSVMSFGMDRATDGGLWLGWGTNEILPMGGAGPGEIRVARLASSGLAATGWTTSGVVLGVHGASEIAQIPPPQSYFAVAHDASDGAYLVSTERGYDGVNWNFQYTLRHLNGSGTSFGGWEDAGLDLGTAMDPGAFGEESASVRALADGHGGVYAGLPTFGSESYAATMFSHIASDGGPLSGGIGSDQRGQETAVRDDGGMFIASFKPSGATGPYEADAYIGVGQSNGGSFFESKGSYYATRYGDVGVAATEDGGAIFAWSQLIDRQGVYAIRLSPAGQVTGVPPSVQSRAFRAWFVRGVGVRVAGGAGAFSLRLHDVSGREVARADADAAGGEWTVPGTAELPSGIYFAKGILGGQAVHARIAVVR